MAGFLVVSSLALLTFLDCMLVDMEKTSQSNAAECSKLAQTECGRVGACVWESGTSVCSPDPCFEKTATALDTCSKTPATGTTCERINTDQLSFCVTNTRVELFAITSARCSLEWGDTKLIEEGLCHTMNGCDTVSPLDFEGGGDKKYYVCNEKPPVTDSCTSLSEEICPYIGKCMWENDQCVADSCWEKTYSSQDGCKTDCVKNIISDSGAQLGYCKTSSHVLHDKCNGGTGSNFITKQVACTGYPEECNAIVTINNYEGGTLYVCSTAAGEFTVESAAVSLNSLATAVSALILLVLLF